MKSFLFHNDAMKKSKSPTQAEYAEKIGIHTVALNAVLRRRKSPSVKLAKRIEEVMGIPWQSWFEDDAPSQTPPPQDEARA